MSDATRSTVMDPPEVERTLQRMAGEVVRLAGGTGDLILMGIHRRGGELPGRIAGEIARESSASVPTGSLDITLYRDDLMAVGPRPVIGDTRVPPGGIDGRVVAIVDDVLYTGRT